MFWGGRSGRRSFLNVVMMALREQVLSKVYQRRNLGG
jgi:hypothetical protein